jgi:hypothetical protein
MPFDLAQAVQEATQNWKLAHNIGGVTVIDGQRIYTTSRRYQSGFVEWIAFDDDRYPDGPRGRGRTEQEAVDDLLELTSPTLG